MKLTTIKIMKRKNLGNYEHEEITLEAVIAEHEDATGAIVGLRELVHASLNGDIMQLGKVADEVLKQEKPGLVAHTVQLSKEGEPNATATVLKEAGEPAPTLAKTEPKKTAPRTRTKPADKLANGQDIPPVIADQEEVPAKNAGGASGVVGQVDTANVSHVQPEAPVANTSTVKGPTVADKNVVLYDSKVKEHRSRFATFLGNTYPKWTPDAKFGKLAEGATASPERLAYEAKVREFSAGLHGKPFEDNKGVMLESFRATLDAFFGSAK